MRHAPKMLEIEPLNLYSPQSAPYRPKTVLEQQLLFTSEMALPLELAHSQEITTSLRYSEGEVGKLFEFAGTKEELRLACVTRDLVYQSAAERLHLFGSRYIDRSHLGLKRDPVSGDWRTGKGEPLDPLTSTLLEKVQGVTKAVGNSNWERNGDLHLARGLLIDDLRRLGVSASNQPHEWEADGTKLYRFESAERLRSLYLTAISENYHPKVNEYLFNAELVDSRLQRFATPCPLNQGIRDAQNAMELRQAIYIGRYPPETGSLSFPPVSAVASAPIDTLPGYSP